MKFYKYLIKLIWFMKDNKMSRIIYIYNKIKKKCQIKNIMRNHPTRFEPDWYPIRSRIADPNGLNIGPKWGAFLEMHEKYGKLGLRGYPQAIYKSLVAELRTIARVFSEGPIDRNRIRSPHQNPKPWYLSFFPSLSLSVLAIE